MGNPWDHEQKHIKNESNEQQSNLKRENKGEDKEEKVLAERRLYIRGLQFPGRAGGGILGAGNV